MSLDNELRNAFRQMQIQVAETRQWSAMIKTQLGQSQRSLQHTALTLHEIQALAAAEKPVPVYEAVGRMFMSQPIDVIVDKIKYKKSEQEKKIATLENTRAEMERSLKESEDNLRELVQQKKDQPS